MVVAPPSPSTFHLRRRTPGSFVLVPFDRQGRYIQGPAEADLRPVPLTVSPQTVVRDQTWGQVKKQR